MTYMTCRAENDSQNAMIVLSGVSGHNGTGGANNVKIYKKATFQSQFGNEYVDWFLLAQYDVATENELNFVLDDVMVKSGATYEYHVDLCVGDSVVDKTSLSVLCDFQGVSVTFLEGVQYIDDVTGEPVERMALVNMHSAFGTRENKMKIDVKRNTDVQYVKTLNKRFPMRVSNSMQDYHTGSVTALFGVSACNDWNRWEANAKNERYMEFLCNGETKYLRTGDGKAYEVSIDGAVDLGWSDYDQLAMLSFSWTQVGNFDITKQDPSCHPGLRVNAQELG